MSNAAYYAQRADQERAAATRATHPNVRHVHLKLAAAYEYRVSACNGSAGATDLPTTAGSFAIEIIARAASSN